MNDLIKILIYLYSIYFSIASLTADQNWDRFIEDPRHAAIVNLASQSRQEVTTGQWLIDIMDTLPDMTQNDSLFEASEIAFLSFSGGSDLPRLKEIESNEVDNADDWRDVVILCLDSEGNIKAVLKWFRKAGKFAKELASMDKLHSLNLQNSSAIYPLAIAKADHEGKTHYLLAEPPANGKTIWALANELVKAESPAREKFLQQTQSALAAFANALAELHNSVLLPKEPSEQLEELCSLHEKRVDSAAALLRQLYLDGPFSSIDDIAPQLKKIHRLFLSQPHVARYAHGDANLSNVFYDPAGSSITFIDLESMSKSIAPDGNPCGEAGEDYAMAVLNIMFLAKCLPQHEYELLMQSFQDAYRNRMGENFLSNLEISHGLAVKMEIMLQSNCESYARTKSADSLELIQLAVQGLHDLFLSL